MNHLLPLLFTAFATGAAGFGAAPSESRDARELISAVLARRTRIVSARYEYVLRTGIRDGERGNDYYCQLWIEGESWRLECAPKGLPHIMGSTGKHSFSMRQYTGSDGKLMTYAGIDEPKSLNGHRYPFHPTIAGTIWFDQTASYVEATAASATLESATEVDGFRCEVVVVRVPDGDAETAFWAFDDDLANGGEIRMYIAPELGFVLPRMEFLGASGVVRKRFEASDFVEASAGLFVPSFARMQRLTGNVPGMYNEFVGLTATNVNEPVDPKHFRLLVPEGASVREAATVSKSGTARHFWASAENRPPDLDMIEVAGSESGNSFWSALAVGFLLGCGAILAMLLIRRWRVRAA
jgi:hypothetical protein